MKRKLDMKDDTFDATIDENAIQRFRKVPPAHYTFDIESFSTLLETKVEKYETKDFEAGGYKWRMVIYPKGKKREADSHHISLFLAITEPEGDSIGWEVNVTAIFFVFDRIRDRYLAVQDAHQIDWRFHKMKMEWGFIEFLSHDALRDPLNGFLVDDRCVFGVEVFVIKSSGKGESLSFVKEPKNGVFTWKINDFSSLNKDPHRSDVFTVEGRKWNIQLHAKGDSRAQGTHLSLFVMLGDSETLQSRRKLYVKWLVRVKDQKNHNHVEISGGEDWFDTPGSGWGFSEFMLLSTLLDPSKGYLVNDSIIVEAKFDLVSVMKDF